VSRSSVVYWILNLIGLISTVLGVFFFLYAGLHDVTFDFLTWIRESAEDQITARVGGPAYFGWPVRGCSSRFYSDDLSFAHAQGAGLSILQLLRGRCLRWLSSVFGFGLHSSIPITHRTKGLDHGVTLGAATADVDSSKQVDQGSDAAEPPGPLHCSLTRKLMTEPVVAADGFSYEKVDMESYLKHYSVSPVTGRPLAFTRLFPNNQLRNVIQAWHREGFQPGGSSGWSKAALDELRCPITMSLMKDAVMTCDGHRCASLVAFN
jgi:hypothetical protein